MIKFIYYILVHIIKIISILAKIILKIVNTIINLSNFIFSTYN